MIYTKNERDGKKYDKRNSTNELREKDMIEFLKKNKQIFWKVNLLEHYLYIFWNIIYIKSWRCTIVDDLMIDD